LDNVTHTLFAVTLARTPLGRAGRGATAAIVIASNAPDIDFVSALGGGTATYMRWHRGSTHGPLGVVGLGLVTAALVWSWLRVSDARHVDGARGFSRAPASFAMLAAVSMIAVAMHILMDLPTSYGTRLLSPFDGHWYAFDWMPIIDVYLLIALAAGLAFGLRSDAARQRNAALVLAIMAANYGMRATAHHQALELAPRLFGPTLPERCVNAPDTSAPLDRWPKTQNSEPRTLNPEPRTLNPEPRTLNPTRCLVEIAALPTFLSPFDWRIVAQMSNAYEIHDVNILDSRFREPAAAGEVFWRQTIRYPNVWTPAVVQAARSPLGQIFLGFSRFPAARAFTDNRGVTIVRFSDIRFAAGLIALEQPVRQETPFSVTMRIDANGTVIDEAFGR
jgi:membrane-bound metal-dependent hydrolase YbcI (DUF457 family)